MKIPFDIKYRPQIESGEYKVETNDHHPVRIICWNKNTGGLDRIVALVAGSSGQEKTLYYTEEGRCVASSGNENKDLSLITPEPELNEFEQAVKDLCWKVGIIGEVFYKDDIIKKTAAELLGIARNQLQKEGLVTMEHLNKACEAEYQSGLADGKNEALKDLPRWKVSNAMRSTMPTVMYGNSGMILYKDGFEISISDLEKLPKEDSDE